MIGTALILALTLFAAARLRGFAPAKRVALGFLVGLGSPVLAVSIIARLGVQPNTGVVLVVFAVLAAVFWTLTRARRDAPDDTMWVGIVGVAFVVASLSALLGRPPEAGVLIDPWAHIAWSRNLPGVFDLYPPGFPALLAVLGLDDPLMGAFRLAPFILHSALAAQFLALGETAGAAWPGATAGLLYLVVPVAFAKFDPPRPELFAAVCVASAWWILLGALPTRRWTYGSLALSTCVLLVTHVSPLEIAHVATAGVCVLAGFGVGVTGSRPGLLVSLFAGAALSLVVSPWPLAVLLRQDSMFLNTGAYATTTPPGAIDIARMWGPGLTAAGAAAAAWFISRFKTIPSEARRFFVGIALLGSLALAPALLSAAGVFIPMSMATYRFYLAAALPLAMGAAVAGGFAWKEGRASRLGVAACALIAILDVCLRPTFSILAGLTAVATLAAAMWTARRPRGAATLAVAAGLAALLGIGVRIAIWRPQAPPEAVWLAEKGDPSVAVVAGWPDIVALDALVPQRVIDGLPGRDGNVARHRAVGISPLRDDLDWCGENAAASVVKLRDFLAGLNALPAYLVVGEKFAESWSLYAAQRDRLVTRGNPVDGSFWSALPCPETAQTRIVKIRSALESYPGVLREFSTDGVAIYRME